jgi:hypothetical protein
MLLDLSQALPRAFTFSGEVDAGSVVVSAVATTKAAGTIDAGQSTIVGTYAKTKTALVEVDGASVVAAQTAKVKALAASVDASSGISCTSAFVPFVAAAAQPVAPPTLDAGLILLELERLRQARQPVWNLAQPVRRTWIVGASVAASAPSVSASVRRTFVPDAEFHATEIFASPTPRAAYGYERAPLTDAELAAVLADDEELLAMLL